MLLPSLETSPNKKLVPIPVKRARAVQHKRVGGHAALLAVKGGHRPHLRKFQLKSFWTDLVGAGLLTPDVGHDETISRLKALQFWKCESAKLYWWPLVSSILMLAISHVDWNKYYHMVWSACKCPTQIWRSQRRILSMNPEYKKEFDIPDHEDFQVAE